MHRAQINRAMSPAQLRLKTLWKVSGDSLRNCQQEVSFNLKTNSLWRVVRWLEYTLDGDRQISPQTMNRNKTKDTKFLLVLFNNLHLNMYQCHYVCLFLVSCGKIAEWLQYCMKKEHRKSIINFCHMVKAGLELAGAQVWLTYSDPPYSPEAGITGVYYHAQPIN